MSTAATEPSVEDLAADMGVVDILLFRRLSASTWAHLGGLGRGRGWAGLVTVEEAEDALLTDISILPGTVRCLAFPTASRILGPYYAAGCGIVRVNHDVVVLLGNPTEQLLPTATPENLRQLAELVETSVADVTPSKHLADELEVLHAVRAVTTGPAADLPGTLRHILAVAVESLSCEVGFLRIGSGRVVSTSSWSGVDPEDAGISAALDALQQRIGDGPMCIQDTDTADVVAPLGRAQGVCSLLALPIPEPVGGLLVVAHTSAGPRGFTTLCQRLGGQVAEAGGILAHTAALREELRASVEAHQHIARHDPLTGLGNRLTWDEALARSQEDVDAGACVTVITLDVDGLKRVNDTHGHGAGDELLRRCAAVLVEHGREGDVAVRLGGDEFALLLPVGAVLAKSRISALEARLAGVTSCERAVVASVGAATAEAGKSVADAAREADAAMYAAKRSRRAAAQELPRQNSSPASGQVHAAG